VHDKLVARVGRNFFTAELLSCCLISIFPFNYPNSYPYEIPTLKGTSPCTPLSAPSTAVPTICQPSVPNRSLLNHPRIRVRERNSKSLNQVTTASTHSGPKSKSINFLAWDFGKHEGGVRFTDPRLSRTEGKRRAEADVGLGVGESKKGQSCEACECVHFGGLVARTNYRNTDSFRWSRITFIVVQLHFLDSNSPAPLNSQWADEFWKIWAVDSCEGPRATVVSG